MNPLWFAGSALLVAILAPILLMLRPNIRNLVRFVRPTTFWGWVDRNSVPDLWICMYYAPLPIFSVFAAITLPIIHAHPVVAGLPMLLWFWVQSVATTAAMVGLALRPKNIPVGEMDTWLLRRDWMGLCLQATSHAVMSVMLADFQIAVVKLLASGILPMTSLVWWLQAYGAAAITPYVFGTALLSLQCLHKIDEGRKLQAAA